MFDPIDPLSIPHVWTVARPKILALIVVFAACNGSEESAHPDRQPDATLLEDSGTGDGADVATPEDIGQPADLAAPTDSEPDGGRIQPRSLTLSFRRVPGSRSFDIDVHVYGADPGRARTDRPVELVADRGELGPTEVVQDGASGTHFRAHLDPLGTGKVQVSATVVGTALQAGRTALVLPEVGEEWDQPEPVGGLVNTVGWEDGADISADGQWLILQYLPVPINCVIQQDIAAPECQKARGPVAGPERPRMPGAERVAADGTITHGCPSLGVPELPFPVPPNSLYSFRRESGATGLASFGDPHPIYIDGTDGCVSAFGPALFPAPPGAPNFAWAYDSPLDSGAGDREGDLFVGTIEPGQDIVLGRIAWVEGAHRLVDSLGTPAGPSPEGHQGNPWVWSRPGGGFALFHDDETHGQDLLVTETDGELTNGPWGPVVRLPEPVSVAGAQESQPFFDGEKLYFRRELKVLAAPYLGGDFGEAASWGATQIVLGDDPTAVEPGTILGAGEPTLAEVEGHRELYFVFVQWAADGTLDLDIGVVRSR